MRALLGEETSSQIQNLLDNQDKNLLFVDTKVKIYIFIYITKNPKKKLFFLRLKKIKIGEQSSINFLRSILEIS